MNWKEKLNPTTGKNFASLQEYVTYLETREAELVAQVNDKNSRTISAKVAFKSGAVSIYGINNRMPVTLYSQQIPRLYEFLTGEEMPATAPIAQWLVKAAPFLSEKDDNEAVKANKLALRKADTSGICAKEAEEKNSAVAAGK